MTCFLTGYDIFFVGSSDKNFASAILPFNQREFSDTYSMFPIPSEFLESNLPPKSRSSSPETLHASSAGRRQSELVGTPSGTPKVHGHLSYLCLIFSLNSADLSVVMATPICGPTVMTSAACVVIV